MKIKTITPQDITSQNFKHLLFMAQIVEARDPYTAGHLWRVAQLSKLLAKQLGVNKTDRFHIALGAYLHDLGKVSVPDHVLNKKDRLDSGELIQMRAHAEMGYRALVEHDLATEIASLARFHHEQWDGYGYPQQLAGDDIPFGARLLGIVDAFDAMTSTRPYRKGMPISEAVKRIQEGSGTQFDPAMVNAFLQIDSNALAHIVGHTDINRPLLECPVCGPVVEMPEDVAKTTFCRVCTGKFNVKREDDGNVWIDFADAYGEPEDLIPKPNMAHIDSNFAEFKALTSSKQGWKGFMQALGLHRSKNKVSEAA